MAEEGTFSGEADRPAEAGGGGSGAPSDEWSRLEPLLDELFDLEGDERDRRLADHAARDAALARRLAGLLASARRDELLRRPLREMVAALLDEEDEAPPSRKGERVGPFALGEELGRGGMGAVYAAERVVGGFAQRVAVKVTKRGVDTDEVLRRFVVERRILGRLEHPNIARLIDGGVTDDGLPWFAMERVDGCSITRFAQERGLPPRERLALFLDACAAVAFAHRHHVVHRDIKPANVLVDAEGRVKLLDFGIAKLLDVEETPLTRTALRPMTPHYAAPEQRDGGQVSERTDVWQLGNLLGELLPPAPGRDLERIVGRARHEDPAQRYGSAEELAADVQRYLDGRPVAARGDAAGYRLGRFVRRHRLAIAAATLVGAALVGGLAAGRRLRSSAAEQPLARFELLSNFPGSHRQATFSPDGRAVAFVTEDATGTPQVFTKELGAREPVQRTSDERGAHHPRWSPRGDRIVYDVPGAGIWFIPPVGGPPRRLVATGFNASFSKDGERLVFETGTSLWLADADGGNVTRLGAGPPHEVTKEWSFADCTPAFSPDGREVVYFAAQHSPVQGDLWSVPVTGGAPRQLTFDGVLAKHPAWLPDGRGIVYSSSRGGGLTLWLLPAGGGDPLPLTTGTGEDTEAAVSQDGRRLIYTNARNLLRLMSLDPRTGERRQLLEHRSTVSHPTFSPDGSRLAVFQGQGVDFDLWTLRPDGGELQQVTSGAGSSVLPEWSADGRWLFHYRMPPKPGFGFARVPAEGGEPELLIPGWRYPIQHGAHVSPDDTRVAYTLLDHGVPVATRVRELRSGAERDLAEPILWPRWSRDGSLLVGRNGERDLVFCSPSGAPCRGLGIDGTEPRWSGDGSEIYFVRYPGHEASRDSRATPLWKVRVDGTGLVRVADLEGPSMHFFYDVSPSGEIAWASFVAGRQELWLAELRPAEG